MKQINSRNGKSKAVGQHFATETESLKGYDKGFNRDNRGQGFTSILSDF